MLTAVRQVEEETAQIIGLHHILPLKTNSNLAKIIKNEHAYCKVKVPSEEVVFESSQSDEASKDINLSSIQPEVHVFNAPAPSADIVRNFYQIQHQMHVAGRSWDDLVVKGSLSTELFIQRVAFDASFWATVFPKLELFFQQHMLPELAFRRIKYGLPRLQV